MNSIVFLRTNNNRNKNKNKNKKVVNKLKMSKKKLIFLRLIVLYDLHIILDSTNKYPQKYISYYS